MDIATHQSEGSVTLNEIAARQKISVKYLWQVINPLKTAGLLSVTRGAKGGYALARPTEKITMLDVVSILEGPLSVVECIGNPKHCDQVDACVSRTVWLEVQRAAEKALSGITLATVLQRCAEPSEADSHAI